MTAVVLLWNETDVQLIRKFAGALWHRIAVLAVRYLEACRGEQLSPLLNAFSLDLIPDATLSRGEYWQSATSAPPWGLLLWGGSHEMAVEDEQPSLPPGTRL